MGGIWWLASYPKSGNTWFRVWLGSLRAEGDAPAGINRLDTPIASSREWLDTTLGFDTGDLHPDEVERLRPAVYDWRPAGDPVRFHKVHDAYTRLDDGRALFGGAATLGAVYLVRNPLDVAPSYAAHSGRTLDRAIAFMGDPAHGHNAHPDRLATQVRQRYLSWSGHVASWTGAEPLAVHVVRYEDMHADPAATLAAAARFLRLPDDAARIARAVDSGRFDRLRAQEVADGFQERPPGMPAFFREGRVGGWRDRLSDAQVARIVADHGPVMRRFGYLDARGNPV